LVFERGTAGMGGDDSGVVDAEAADAIAVAAAERHRRGVAPWPTLEPAIARIVGAAGRPRRPGVTDRV
jgi:hypothetical protein